jgi:hypothetical protein
MGYVHAARPTLEREFNSHILPALSVELKA